SILMIDIVGAVEELNYIELFHQVQFFINSATIIRIFSTEQPSFAIRKEYTFENSNIEVILGTLYPNTEKRYAPDCIVCFNAGLFIFKNWLKFIEICKKENLANVYVTEFDEESAKRSSQMVGKCSYFYNRFCGLDKLETDGTVIAKHNKYILNIF
ncbi:MAG: hypothetical protein MHPSP_001360, partial [Paramarteilia canceri]